MKAASKTLTNVLTKWNSRKVENPNVPFSNAELREHAEATPGPWKLFNESPNRRARRFTADNPRIVNNRAQTRGRQNDRVLNNMSYFALRMHGYQAMGIKIAPQKHVTPTAETETAQAA